MKKVFWSASIWLVNCDKTQTDTDHVQLSMLIWILDGEKVLNSLYSILYLECYNNGILMTTPLEMFFIILVYLAFCSL